jgi:hypothetical protein
MPITDRRYRFCKSMRTKAIQKCRSRHISEKYPVTRASLLNAGRSETAGYGFVIKPVKKNTTE